MPRWRHFSASSPRWRGALGLLALGSSAVSAVAGLGPLALSLALSSSAALATAAPQPSAAPAPAAPAAAVTDAPASPAPRPYREVRNELEAARRALAARQAAGEQVDAAAASALTRALTDEILPRWLGVAWARGKASLARAPDDRDAGVNCASFLVAAMEGAGLRFAHRGQLVRAPALRILEAVAPEESEPAAILRWKGTIPALERELVRRGPGLYLLGLAQHIGFAVVPAAAAASNVAGAVSAPIAPDAPGAVGAPGAPGAPPTPVVRLIHASRATGQVVDEPMVTSRALLSSRGAPIFAVRLVRPALVKRWLAGSALGPR